VFELLLASSDRFDFEQKVKRRKTNVFTVQGQFVTRPNVARPNVARPNVAFTISVPMLPGQMSPSKCCKCRPE
jgi:hypothetical protein